MQESGVPVIIAGAGPVGLSLALGLARHGVRSVVLEREPSHTPHSRALGVLTRTMEIFRGWGILDEFLSAGTLLTEISIYRPGRAVPDAVIDLGVLRDRTATPGFLILPQSETEALLLRRVRETGVVEVRFGHALREFLEEESGVTVRVGAGTGEYQIRAEYLAGCDGAHSTVREQLGWRLEGKTYPARVALADVRLGDDRDRLPWPRVCLYRGGVLGALRYEPEHWRIITTPGAEETDDDVVSPSGLSARVERLFGPGPFELLWSSVFRIHCRSSPHFRRGRVALAGDAAHLNSPAGGQGMNSGIQDAHNLAWKLARALEGGSDTLLPSYEQERRGAALEEVARYTDLLTRAFVTAPAWVRSLSLGLAQAAISSPLVLERLALRAGMLDTRYRRSAILAGEGRWLGSRAPDGELISPEGERVRLLDLAGPGAALLLFDDGRLPAWNREAIETVVADIPRLRVLRLLSSGAGGEGCFHDPGGSVWKAWGLTGSTAALLRPDGYVGWTAQRPTTADLRAGVARALGWNSGVPSV